MDLISPGRVLGNRYELVEPLARGGMATVWIADDPVLSRRVAVKVLRADLAADDATRTRFRNEAIAAARLNHPNIVTTLDTGDDEGTAYIVMELVDGTNLRRLVDERGALPVRDVLRIGRQIADALEAAHRAGLVHRDVKPANVLVPSAARDGTIDGVPQGPVKVTDFGIAKASGADDLTRTGMVMGTARYLAPEQVNGRTADARTDVYALGLLLYELCCGHQPFGGDTDIATAMARLTTTPPPIRAERPDVPRALDDVVHRCLARDPAQRFASAAEVSRALALVAGGAAVPGRPPAPRAPVAPAARPAPTVRPAPSTRAAAPPVAAAPRRRRRRTRSLVWVVVVLVLAAAAGVGAYLVVRDQTSAASGDPSGAGLPSATDATVLATTFDPQGEGPPGENDDLVLLAFDGDPDSAWRTESYQTFSAGKAGVGLALDLQSDFDLSTVAVATVEDGWSATVYVSDRDVSDLASLDDWGSSSTKADVDGNSHTFDLRGVAARSVLVWFTSLPTHPDGSQHLAVTEIRLG